MTAGILLRLAEGFDIDVKAFASESSDSAGATQLAEIFSDPMLADLGIGRSELVELADNAPTVAEGIARLYTAVREVQRCPTGEERRADPRSLITPETWVRDYIQAQRNHWPELEDASETLGGALNDPLTIAEPLRKRLKDSWGVDVRVVVGVIQVEQPGELPLSERCQHRRSLSLVLPRPGTAQRILRRHHGTGPGAATHDLGAYASPPWFHVNGT